MNKYIVTTTIYPPSEALIKFLDFYDWQMIIIGDQRTPHEEYKNFGNAIYLSPDEQSKKYPKLSEFIGWNKIMRRNIGFVEAYKLGAEIVASVDDDNIPYPDWGKRVFVGETIEVDYYETDEICFDPLSITNYPHLWHRGFPLQLLQRRKISKPTRKKIKVDAQADFWNGDPDIDAICRLEHNPICKFDPKRFPMTSNVVSPFNSQNTFILADTLKDYFMFPYIGRMDDIWGSYYYQSKGHSIVDNKPSIYQERNKQDVTKNMKNEILGYLKTKDLILDIKNNPENVEKFVPNKSWQAYCEYRKCF